MSANNAQENIAFFKWLSDEDGVTEVTPAQLEAMKKVCAKTLGCRVLGVPLPTAIVEALYELREESADEGMQCPDCRADGWNLHPDDKCETCGGSGRSDREE